MSEKHQIEAINVSPQDRTHAQALEKIIQADIAQAGGSISFSCFMSLALYHPELGYYMNAHEKFGPRGDFITAPLVSPLYAHTLARSVINELREYPCILEWGAGNGQLAKDILDYLAAQGLNPQYMIYDISPACRELQRETLRAFGEQVTWVGHPPVDFKGVIIANEVLDALPVDLFHYQSGKLYERVVTWVKGRFEFVDKELSELENAEIKQIHVENDYISEIHIAAADLLRTWLRLLKAGKLLIIDYGFLRDIYYHPQRTRGTLMCHYQHIAHDDPFFLPGRQDITAHVNFSELIDIANASGFEATLYTQAEYLIEHGILDLAQSIFSENIAQQRGVSQAIRLLLEPQEMGESFKVLECFSGTAL